MAASLSQHISDLALRVSTECKSLRALVNGNAVDLSALTTTQKGNLVASINELKTSLDAQVVALAGQISDTTTVTNKTWSSSKVASAIAAAVAQTKSEIIGGAPGALDTLKELADAIADDASFASTITTSLALRVRVDTAQTFTDAQKLIGRTNLGAVASIDVGVTDTDFVAVFQAGLT